MKRLLFDGPQKIQSYSTRITRITRIKKVVLDKPEKTVVVKTSSMLSKLLSKSTGVDLEVNYATTKLKYFDLLKGEDKWKAHVEEPLPLGDDIVDLISLLKETPQIVIFKGKKGHFYFQSSYLGVCEELDTDAVSKYLEYAFLSFPSLKKTIISKDESGEPVSAVINFNDNVRLAPMEVYLAGDWRIFILTAMTDDIHALAGQLPHIVAQNLKTGKVHTMRPGIGYLNLIDTPGKSLLDASNELFGAWSWILADALAKAHLKGDKEEVKRLEKSLRMKFGRFFFSGGGFVSRDVLQPFGRYVYPHTAAAFMVAYLVLVALIIAYLFKQLKKTGNDDDDGPKIELLQ